MRMYYLATMTYLTYVAVLSIDHVWILVLLYYTIEIQATKRMVVVCLFWGMSVYFYSLHRLWSCLEMMGTDGCMAESDRKKDSSLKTM